MRWCTPYVPFERKTVFCMTKAQAHEVYGLPDSGVDARSLTGVDFTDNDWLKCFNEVPKRGSKVKCRDVKPEFWNKFYTLFTSVYQEPPTNYGMEVTKGFARGFLYEQLKGKVDWALFSESMITHMDAAKLQEKKQRWAFFHSSSAPQSSRRMTRTPDHLEAGQETPNSRVDDVQKFFLSGPPSLADLDTIYNMVESKHALALSEYNEVSRKLELHKADVHRDEGANLLVDKLKAQLKDAEAAFHQKAQDNKDAVDAVHLVQLEKTVSTLSLTIQTLEGLVVDKASAEAMARVQGERDFLKEVEECARAQLDFVRSMQVKRSTILLSAPPPKVPPVDMGTFALFKPCSACGLMMYDDDGLGMFLLPCNHAFHMYCFGHIAASKDTCMERGCMQPISQAMRSLVMLSSTDANVQGVQSQTKPSSVPLSHCDASKSMDYGIHPKTFLALS